MNVAGLRRHAVITGACLLVVALTACERASSAGADMASAAPGSRPGGATSQQPDDDDLQLVVSVDDQAEDVPTDEPLRVEAKNGQLASVTLTGPNGAAFTGTQEGSVWTLGRALAPKTDYTLTVVATGTDGASTTVTRQFSTRQPTTLATYRVLPDGATVGVGMPASVLFDSAVNTPEQRAAVEKALTTTVTPAQSGSWGWSSSTQLYWRPKTFWKPGTKVVVNAPLAGLQTGEDKYVGEDKGATFTVGSARISKVDLKSHRMTVAENGKLIANYPISAGMPGAKTTTRSGVKVITEKSPKMVMDSSTYGVMEGDPDYYKQEVSWALRVTNTGEFLHSAPWSVWAQGRLDVSHGCVNMGPRDAKEMYDASKIGDVVAFVGSNRQFKPGEGLDVWVYDWATWRSHSAVTGGATHLN